MSVTLVPVPAAISKNIQAEMPKSIIPGSEQFDSDQIKFEDQQREM